jgi:GT2 family glycosyltransferase
VIRQANAGPAKARNTGAANAVGRFLAFTDDDCEPARDWLQQLARAFGASPGVAIGGRTVNALTANLHSGASQLLIDYLYAYYNTGEGGARFFASNNLAMPAESFRAMGGFDTEFPLAAGEDRDLCDRWLGQGYRLVYAPEATVNHSHALTFRGFCRQHFAYGRGAYRFHQLRSRRQAQPLRVEPLRFYFNLLRFPFERSAGTQCWALAALLAVSQILNVAGFFWERHLSSGPR